MIEKIKFGIMTSAILLSSTLLAGDTIESIFFLGDDLKTGIAYKNVRYDNFGTKSMYFGVNFNKNDLSYIKPNHYVWSKAKLDGEMNDKLTFSNVNTYSYLERTHLKESNYLQNLNEYGVKEEGSYYAVFDGGACVGNGCIQSENIISIVIPKKFQIKSYEAYEKENEKYEYNKNADFKLIDNTLTLYSNNIQGAYIKLWFKDTSLTSDIYKNVSESLSQYNEISISRTDTETTITMPMDNVFDSGKAIAKPQGKEWLYALVEALKDKHYKEIRVEGHTDNTPIKGTYPSNWELSSARASDAVRFMISQGLDGSKIAAVGYADTRPIVNNNSKENKAKNRRIEITIVGNPDTKDVVKTKNDTQPEENTPVIESKSEQNSQITESQSNIDVPITQNESKPLNNNAQTCEDEWNSATKKWECK